MGDRDVVVIGGSAGGIEALRRIVAGLPAGLAASVLIVVDTGERSRARLPDLLGRQGPLPAAYAVSGQRLTPGLITVAPPGQHLIVTAGEILRLHSGPLVHRARPAIDPLMASAARVCGRRVIAVVLSGGLHDGSAGAAAVAAAGGAVLVQEPGDARHPTMPAQARSHVPEALVWPAAKLGPAIADLVGAPDPAPAQAVDPSAARADGLNDALWVAVARLQAHAAAQRRLQERLDPACPLTAQARSQADRALHAADLIVSHVLPIVRSAPDHGRR